MSWNQQEDREKGTEVDFRWLKADSTDFSSDVLFYALIDQL